MKTSPPAAIPDAALMLDVRAVAALLDCSQRHVVRLAEAGRMPAPHKLGALNRWNRDELKAWIAAGCPANWKGGDQ